MSFDSSAHIQAFWRSGASDRRLIRHRRREVRLLKPYFRALGLDHWLIFSVNLQIIVLENAVCPSWVKQSFLFFTYKTAVTIFL